MSCQWDFQWFIYLPLLHSVINFLSFVHKVFFYSDGTYWFSLFGKPTNQSSLYTQNLGDGHFLSGTSDKAVDGKTNTRFTDGSCTHTEDDDQPWWSVDMGTFVTIFSVTITKREQYCK